MTDTNGDCHRRTDVLVIGGGPTGLSLGCDLKRRGVRVRVVEKASEATCGSRGKGLQPRTLEVFDNLGIVERVLGEGSEYPPLRVHAGPFAVPWDLVKRERPTPATPYPNLWMLPQHRTEAILCARFAELGGAVEAGTELVSFSQDDGYVVATLRRNGGEETVRTRYVVGADGGRSKVRKLASVPFSGDGRELSHAIVGDVTVDGLDRRFWHAWPFAKFGPVALCPLPGGDLFQLFAQNDGTPFTREPCPEAVTAFLRTSIGERAPSIHSAPWLSLYRPNVRLAEHYRIGRVLLAGDAAHVHPPTGAQGLNAGVQDAFNLGWKLAAVLLGAPDSLLDTYEEERRPVAAGILDLSTATFRSKWRIRGRDTKQLRTSYGQSSIACERRRNPGRVRAGDRAPDARGTDVGGRPFRVFDALRGPRATVLAFGAAVADVARVTCAGFDVNVVTVTPSIRGAMGGDIVDARGDIRRIYDASSESFMLIRPDGYVGFAGEASEARAFAEYLPRIASSRCRAT